MRTCWLPAGVISPVFWILCRINCAKDMAPRSGVARGSPLLIALLRTLGDTKMLLEVKLCLRKGEDSDNTDERAGLGLGPSETSTLGLKTGN